MLLQSPLYLIFLAGVTILYWILPSGGWRKIFLLVVSYYFYALFDYRFAILLFCFSIVVYGIGKGISRGWQAPLLAGAGVGISLGLLGLFKYANFFLDGIHPGLQLLGVDKVSPGLKLILPIGISFYTFQAISYVTEIYRKKLSPTQNFTDLALYLAFFPKLIAGPFVKPASFLKQLQVPRARPDSDEFKSALKLLLLGLVKKILIADGLASLSAVAFRAASSSTMAGSFPSPLYIQGFYLYAFQIYADFSGYTDLARASAAFLGFHLPENFQQPYLSSTITGFWNRWHMSLTQWFREYLYFPLSRKLLLRYSKRRAVAIQTIATLVTMTLIGFWHGAAWIFIAWGIWHGFLLVMENIFRIKPGTRVTSILQGVLTFHLVGIGWVLFGSESFEAAWRFLVGLFSFTQMHWLPHYLISILLTAGLVFGIDLFSRKSIPSQKKFQFVWQPLAIIVGLLILSSLYLLNTARGATSLPFIYGRF